MKVKSGDEGRTLSCGGFHPLGRGTGGQQPPPTSLRDHGCVSPPSWLGRGFWGCPAPPGTLSGLPPCRRSEEEEEEEERKGMSVRDASPPATDGPEPVSSRV